jgi:hypothetical protein
MALLPDAKRKWYVSTSVNVRSPWRNESFPEWERSLQQAFVGRWSPPEAWGHRTKPRRSEVWANWLVIGHE